MKRKIAASFGLSSAKKLFARGKTLTDMQILGCELHQNALGGWALSGPAGGATAIPRSPSHY